MPFEVVVFKFLTHYATHRLAFTCFQLSSLTIIQFFIIYVPSQQLQGQLQTQHSVDTGNYITDKHNIKSKTNYRQALEKENTLIQKK
jgi:hypothetical protein